MPSQEHAQGTLNEPISDAEPETEVPAKASRPLWGEVRRAGAVLFSLLPQGISSLYHESKALQNGDLLVPVEGEERHPTSPWNQNLCKPPVS